MKISDIENVEIAFKDGVGYDSEKLVQSVHWVGGDKVTSSLGGVHAIRSSEMRDTTGHAMTSEILKNIRENGFALIRRWRQSESTLDIASSIGKIVDIGKLAQKQGIPTVQSLRPRLVEEATPNQYSGMFGRGDFPLHTDLAHWARPPRYFVLRSRVGSDSVSTSLLPASAVSALVPHDTVRRALTRPRRWRTYEPHCLLPLVFFADGEVGFRWDSIFIIPVNEPGFEVAQAMSRAIWHDPELQTLELTYPGDTLIVDNWRVLHGRSRVPDSALNRIVERSYLSELQL